MVFFHVADTTFNPASINAIQRVEDGYRVTLSCGTSFMCDEDDYSYIAHAFDDDWVGVRGIIDLRETYCEEAEESAE